MKQSGRVAELLAELRALSENDFERHRIDVLERDLTNPPKVEIVDETHQKFDGKVYTKYDNSGNYCRGSKRLHREVWKFFHGEIPAGYDIHHCDLDHENNDISNLQMLTKAEHRALHSELRTGQPHPKCQKETFVCKVCGKSYQAFNTGRNYFCSTSCQNKYFRRTLTKTCKWCGKSFETTNSRTQFCSLKCASFSAGRRVKKICPVCGKIFETTASKNNKTCSKACGGKLSRQPSQ